jgi:hypothetical protein
MATGNMGIKRKDLEPKSPFGGIAVAVEPGEADKQRGEEVKYPSFDLTNKHIEAAGLKDVNPDDVVEFTVKARVMSVKKKSKQGANDYDSDRVELEIQNISDVTMTESEKPDDEESDEDKDLAGKMGFASAKGMKRGGGSVSPSQAGVKLK